LKILFVNENIGGHRTVHANLRAALDERDDVQADFLNVPHPPPFGRRLVGVRIPGLARLDVDLQPLRAQLATSVWVRRHLARRASDYDAVHVYTQSCGLLSAAILAAHPTVVTLDTTNARNAYRLPYRHPTRFTPLAVRVTRPFEQRVYRSAGALVANSQWAASSLLDDYGVTMDKVTVIPFGITVPSAAALPARSPGGRSRIAFIGSSLDRKGGRALLDLHQERFADQCDLVLVTKERVAPARNVTVINDLEPGDPRLWSILRSATVFVFPSEIDQAPNVVLEAAAAELPVVALGVAAIPEMVRHGETGLLVAPDDPRGLAAAITRLLDDPREALAMGVAGRAHVEAQFDVRRSVARLLDVFKAVATR
jgi:glycosyltransferase involved in cell wall biosynthesis